MITVYIVQGETKVHDCLRMEVNFLVTSPILEGNWQKLWEENVGRKSIYVWKVHLGPLKKVLGQSITKPSLLKLV